jgi:hypothetical protein
MNRMFVSAGLAATIALFGALPISGQSSPNPPLVITAYNGGPPIAFTTPKTPWGDPDLQGVWSSDDTSGIPMSRAQNVTGMYLNDEAWAARQKQTQQGVQNALNAIGTFRGDYARRSFRQTSLVVDPPDGRAPQPTDEARKRAAPRDRGTFGNGPFDTPEDFTLYDRCITRGIIGSVLRVVYGNGNRIVQAPGMVVISYEMIHDTRVLYTDGRPHLNQSIRQYLGDSRARWEGDELVVETTNLTDKTSIGLNGNGLRHSDKMKNLRALQAGRERHHPVPDHDRRSGHVRKAVHDLAAVDAARGERAASVRVSRREPRGVQSLSAERAEDKALADDLAKGIKRERRGVQESGAGGGGGGRGRGAGAGGRGGGRGAGAGNGNQAPPEGDQER